MAGLADREAAKGVRETYQYVVDKHAVHFVIDDGAIEVRDGLAEDPSVVVSTDEETLGEIASGRTRASQAIATGALTIAGDRQASKRLNKIFSRVHRLASANAAVAG